MNKYILTAKILNCKGLIYNGKPANDCNTLIKLHIQDKASYFMTEPISKNANPQWNVDLEVPVSDPSRDKLIIEVVHQFNDHTLGLSDPILLNLQNIEIDSNQIYDFNINLSKDDEPVGVLSIQLKLNSISAKYENILDDPIIVLFYVDIKEITIFEEPVLFLQLKDHDKSDSIISKIDLYHTEPSSNQYFSIISNDPKNDVILITLKTGDTVVFTENLIISNEIKLGCIDEFVFSFETEDDEEHFKVYYCPYKLETFSKNPIKIFVEICDAEILSGDGNDDSLLFVKVSVGDEEVTTEAKKKDKIIDWDQTFEFTSNDPLEDKLTLTLYNKGAKSSVNKRMNEVLSYPILNLPLIKLGSLLNSYNAPLKMKGKEVGNLGFKISNVPIIESGYTLEFTVTEIKFTNCEEDKVIIEYGLTSNSDDEPQKVNLNEKKTIKNVIIEENSIIFLFYNDIYDFICDMIGIELSTLIISGKHTMTQDVLLDGEKTGTVTIDIWLKKSKYKEEDDKIVEGDKIVEDDDDKIVDDDKQIDYTDFSNCFISDEDEQFHEVEKRIGEGTTSVTYKVIDKKNNRVMCKKVLKIKNDESKFENARNALKEFDVLRLLNHPCICKMIGINTTEKVKTESNEDLTTIALFLEYCPNSLKFFIENEKLDNTLKTSIAVEIAHAMLFIHNKGLIHRDLKIENIMLDDHLNVKLVDFGLVKIYQCFSEDLSTQEFSMTKGIGTFAYMSPEMMNEEDYDYKTDVYSYGVVLYFIFVGQLPKFKDKVSKKVPFPSDSSITKDCIHLIRKCLNFQPEKRPSFKEILKKMRKYKFNLAEGVDFDTVDKRDKKLKSFDSKK